MGIEAFATMGVVCDNGQKCERISLRPAFSNNPMNLLDFAKTAGWTVGLDGEGHLLTYCGDKACQERAKARLTIEVKP